MLTLHEKTEPSLVWRIEYIDIDTLIFTFTMNTFTFQVYEGNSADMSVILHTKTVYTSLKQGKCITKAIKRREFDSLPNDGIFKANG